VYDIVGFDPRGVAMSEPIACFTSDELDANLASDSKPDNEAEIAATLTDSKAFAEKCAEKTEYLEHFTTSETARDMDILRAALGETKLNYVGKSYGTYLGTLYAEIFPANVGRFVLDGAVDPNIPMKDQNLAQAMGFDGALKAFVKDCMTQSDCPFTGTPAQAQATIIATLQAAATDPLPQENPADGDDRMITESLILVGMASSLYDDVDGWPKLRQAFTESEENYGDTFLQLADEYSGRNPDGTFRSNDFDSGAVIDCLDWRDNRTLDQYKADAKEFATKAPVFGPYIAFSGVHCQFFPQPSTQRAPNTLTEIKTAPIIVIGTIRDPATPYAWSVSLAKIFTGSSLISLDGDGHTGHSRGSACVDDAVDAFLLKGTLPLANLSCDLEGVSA
jgi:pimeloyl-ACP methyl ester carboxylesterase